MPAASGSATIAVVYNPVKIRLSELEPAVRRRAATHGWTGVRFHETTVEDPGTGMAREAVAAGSAVVVAVGGDGTVRAVAGALAGTVTSLGIVPRGTGNLLARNLGIPLDDVDAALRVALGGRTAQIDLGAVTYRDEAGEDREEVFLVMLGAGMDADMIAGTDDALKARVGWPAYVGAFASTLLTGHRIRVRYRVDEGRWRDAHTRSLLVGNCGILQGGVVLLPDARIDDGKLDVLALRPKGVVGWLRVTYAVVVEHTVLRRAGAGFPEWIPSPTERDRTSERVLDFRQGTTVECEVLESPAPFQIDGEDLGEVDGFSARVRHRAVSVRLPVGR